MTAVANPPSFPHDQPTWGSNGGQPVNSVTEDVRVMFGRKGLQRSSSASSISSASSTSSATTVATNGSGSQFNGTPASSIGEVSQWPNTAPRKRPQVKSSWPPGKPDGHGELGRMTGSRQPLMNGSIGAGPPIHAQSGAANQAMPQSGAPRPLNESGAPVLYLISLNGTFDRKTIHVPFEPDKLRIGRQTNQRTVPTPSNGYFDSKVLSRQHAEIWADRSGKIWIRDVKSSNGTFVNGSRLSPENRESEPHELQTADHLELGIDIVSEDQKTVVHHKVAAKVEHAGFLSATSNLLDMNFGDLDPGNGSVMQPAQGTMQMRSRLGGAASMAANGRTGPGGGMMSGQAGGISHQRGYWLTPITAEQIVKRLQTEMRGARLQHQDLDRTGRFVNAMLSKDDVKDLEKPDIPEPPKQQSLINGSALPFRADPKARFSDPPAPPPQQPLPEKPDVPILKRPINDRQKSHPNISPIRDNNASQIQQLLEDLKTTKRELEGRDARLRELEESLQNERMARESAEELARRLEDTAAARTQATAPVEEEVSADPALGSPTAVHMNGIAKGVAPNGTLDEAFEPPQEVIGSEESSTAALALGRSLANQAESTQTAAAEYQSRVDTMTSEIMSLKDQLELWRLRCETVEAERDADRKTLSEKVAQIRQAEKEREASAAASASAASRETSRGRSKGRQQSGSRRAGSSGSGKALPEETAQAKEGSEADGVLPDDDDGSDKPTLSRTNTITPQTPFATTHPQDPLLAASLPYASMLGVVLIGMGLMAYINGWQPAPKR